MLVLGRREGEELFVWHKSIDIRNDDASIIKFTFDLSSRSMVKVGIDAPQDYKVYRKEIYERIIGGR